MSKQTSAHKHTFSVNFATIDEVSDGQRLDNFLLKTCKGVPKSHLYKAIRSGQVRVNKGRANAETRLNIGDIVRIPPFRVSALETERKWIPKADFPIIYEDEVMLVINKPAGIAVHGGSGVSFGIIEQLRASRPEAKFLELAHRLDRETSGLLMIAKKRSALVALQDYMRQGLGNKFYQALVCGDWCNDRQHIKLPLLKYKTPQGERRVRVDHNEGRFSHTIVTMLKRFGSYTLLGCQLRTGRTHQIRVHLASCGFPIVGDDKYGKDEVRYYFTKHFSLNRMFLHASELDMPHPITGDMLRLQAPLPEACQHVLHLLSQSK